MREIRARGARLPGLPVLTVGTALFEAALVSALAPEAALPLAIQVSAPEPFGIFHDLRWLLVYHPSWLAFAGEAAAFVVFRTLMVALAVRAAWPSHATAPGFGRLVRCTAPFVLLAGLLLSPWAALLFGMAVVPLSWLFFVAVPVVLAVALLIHHGAADAGWWRHRPPGRALAWVVLTFFAVSAGGALLTAVPPPATVAVVVVAALFNARAWRGVVEAVVEAVVDRQPARRQFLPVAPVGVAALVVVVGVSVAVGVRVARPSQQAHRQVAEVAAQKPVLIVQGFGSRWDGRDPAQQLPGRFAERRFSYRGMSPTGRPLSYEPDDTLQSLRVLAWLMDVQVRRMHRETGRRVSVVAESEGSLLARHYLATHPDAPVDQLVMLSPVLRPGRVYYPPRGRDGWGAFAAWELRGLAVAVRQLTPFQVSADSKFFRSIAEQAPLLRTALSCHLPRVQELLVVPVADAVVGSEVALAPGVRVVHVPAFHGGMLGNEHVQELVVRQLTGLPVDGEQRWSVSARVVGALAAAWQVPELPFSVNPAWEGLDDGMSCEA